jgi:predicted RNA-binding Zn-ribbon protein involved in translation (DUF1610 family)
MSKSSVESICVSCGRVYTRHKNYFFVWCPLCEEERQREEKEFYEG